MQNTKTIRLKCAGCDQAFSVPSYLITKCDLYVCGIGGCDINSEYTIPNKKLHTTIIVADAGVKLNGVQYRLPTKGDIKQTTNSKNISILRNAELKQNSKSN